MNGTTPAGGPTGRDSRTATTRDSRTATTRDSRTATMQTVPFLAAPTPPDPGWQPAAPPPLPPYAPTPPTAARLRSRRQRALFRLVLVVSVLVAAGGGVYAWATYQTQSQPGAVAQSYLAALARGDAPAALSYGHMPSGPEGLLTSAMLRKQNALAPMTNIVVLAAKPSGNVANAAVQYTLRLDGQPVTEIDTIPMVREGHTWKLKAVAVPLTIHLEAGANYAEIDGARVPTNSQLYFPGVLPLTFDTPALQVMAAQRVVHFNGASTMNVPVGITGRAQSAVWASLNQALQQCLKGTFAAQASCPLPASTTAVPGTLLGTTTYAANPAKDALDVTVLDQPDAALHIESQAAIVGHYQQLDFDNLPQSTPYNDVLAFVASSSPIAPYAITWTVL